MEQTQEVTNTPEEDKPAKSSANVTKIIIAFFAWVVFPIILVVGYLEYQKRKHAHEEKLAGVENENKKVERRNKVVGQLGKFALSVFDKVSTYF